LIVVKQHTEYRIIEEVYLAGVLADLGDVLEVPPAYLIRTALDQPTSGSELNHHAMHLLH
jgi:hypothetical protein